MNYIAAVKIHLNSTQVQRDDLGLYNIGGSSFLMWSELPLTGVTDTWKYGIISEIGISVESGDFKTGGGVVSAQSFDLTVYNNTQMSLKLDELGIKLVGLKVEHYIFVGTDADSDNTEVYRERVGYIDRVTGWNQMYIKISVKNSMHKRRSNLGTLFEKNDIIPITYGISDPANDVYFKAVRTNSTYDVLSQEDLSNGLGTCLPGNMKLFPVYQMIGASPSLIYQVRLGYMDSTALPNGDEFVGKYVLIKEGTGEGFYRKIETATVIGSGQAIIELTFSDHFPEDLVGSWAANGENQTWLQFVNIEREYELDNLLCNGFYDSDDNKLVNRAEIYSENDDDIIRIPQYGYDVDTDNAEYNSLVIDPKLFNNYAEYESGWTYLADGLFCDGSDTFSDTTITITGDEDSIFDQTTSTSYIQEFEYKMTGPGQTLKSALTFKLPSPPDNFTYTNVYLCVNLTSTGRPGALFSAMSFDVKKRGYIDRKASCIPEYDMFGAGTVGINNIPDFYLIPNGDTNNVDFYRTDGYIVTGSEYSLLNGYSLINLDIENNDDWESIVEIVIESNRPIGDTSAQLYSETFEIKEMFLLIESEANIKTEVYV